MCRDPRSSSCRRRSCPWGSGPRRSGTRADGPRCARPCGCRRGTRGCHLEPPTTRARRRARAAGPSGGGLHGAPGRRSAAVPSHLARRPPPAQACGRSRACARTPREIASGSCTFEDFRDSTCLNADVVPGGGLACLGVRRRERGELAQPALDLAVGGRIDEDARFGGDELGRARRVWSRAQTARRPSPPGSPGRTPRRRWAGRRSPPPPSIPRSAHARPAHRA